MLDFCKELRDMPLADWVIEMRGHYDEYGFYRAEDLRRVLGEQTRGVSVPRCGEDVVEYLGRGLMGKSE